MIRRISIAAFALATAGAAALSFGRPGWTETGDAPYAFATGAQTTVGSGALTTITGTTNDASGDNVFFHDVMDAYLIRITDVTTFRATLNNAIDPAASIAAAGADFGGTDSRLFLMDASGQPLVMNDDSDVGAIPFASTVGTPQSFAIAGTGGVASANATLTAPQFVNGGLYMLVVGSYDAIAAHDNGDTTFTETMENPDGFTVDFNDLAGVFPGAPSSDEWVGSTLSTFDYTVALRGAAFAQNVPEPASLGLLGVASIAGLVRRRHR